MILVGKDAPKFEAPAVINGNRIVYNFSLEQFVDRIAALNKMFRETLIDESDLAGRSEEHRIFLEELNAHKGLRNVLLVFYPKDFTHVCPTELIALQERLSEF